MNIFLASLVLSTDAYWPAPTESGRHTLNLNIPPPLDESLVPELGNEDNKIDKGACKVFGHQSDVALAAAAVYHTHWGYIGLIWALYWDNGK